MRLHESSVLRLLSAAGKVSLPLKNGCSQVYKLLYSCTDYMLNYSKRQDKNIGNMHVVAK
jgi:hypothetical protein